jgi:hypothetical protein
MTAFHSNWTKPYFFRNGHIPYAAEDYEIPATILSALQWRNKNGRIKRIAVDFPGELETLANRGILAPYFKGEHSF